MATTMIGVKHSMNSIRATANNSYRCNFICSLFNVRFASTENPDTGLKSTERKRDENDKFDLDIWGKGQPVVREFPELILNYNVPKKLFKEPRAKRKVYNRMDVIDRYKKMSVNQDWTKTWPAAATFKWSVVPLPLRQGVTRNKQENKGVVPDKVGNTELLKIPNFLHLTPPHVWKHCRALKKFCTEWPEGLESKEDCRLHFPVEVITSDYCFAGPSIRDARARVVRLRVKMSDLELDDHAYEKFLKLVGDRYNKETDEVTFVVDSCPTKKQNLDYANYLLTTVYLESWNKFPWEDSMEETDYRNYNWKVTESKKKTMELLKTVGEVDKESGYYNESEEGILEKEKVKNYEKAIAKLHDDGESLENLDQYKETVLKMLNMKKSS